MGYSGNDRRAGERQVGPERLKGAQAFAMLVSVAITVVVLVNARRSTSSAEADVDALLGIAAATLIAMAAVLRFLRWRVVGQAPLLWLATSLFMVAVSILLVYVIPSTGAPSGIPVRLGAGGVMGALVSATFSLTGPTIDSLLRVRRVLLVAVLAAAAGVALSSLVGVDALVSGSGVGGGAWLWLAVAMAWIGVAVLEVSRSWRQTGTAFPWFGVLAFALAQHAAARSFAMGWGRSMAPGHTALLVLGAVAVCVGAVTDLGRVLSAQRSALFESSVSAQTIQARISEARAGSETRAHTARNALCAIAGATQLLERHHDRLAAETRASLVESVASEVARLQGLISFDVIEEDGIADVDVDGRPEGGPMAGPPPVDAV